MATNTKVIRVVFDEAAARASAARMNTLFASVGSNNAGLNSFSAQLGTTGSAATQAAARLQAANTNTIALGQSSAATASRLNSLGGVMGSLSQSANNAGSAFAGLGGRFGGIAFAGAAAGIAAVGGALIGFATASVNASAQFQAYRASLTTILGDTEKAAGAFGALTEFAAKTPFSLQESVEGFIKLKALGLQPSEAAMMSYGNTASSMGKSLNQMVEAVADAATGEFERLKEFGIKSKVQGDQVAFTFGGVTTKVGNNSAEIQKYLQQLGETKFAGAMERQMATFGGALSGLQDRIQTTFAAIGDGGLASAVAKVINLMNNGIGSITPLLVSVGNVIGGVISGLAAMASGVGTAFSALNSGGEGSITIMEGVTAGFNLIGHAASLVGNVVGATFGAIGTIVGAVTSTIRSLFGSAFSWLVGASEGTSQGVGNSLIGVLRAGKYVGENLPKIFSIALNSIGGMFSIIGQRISSFLSGNWNAFEGMGGAIAAGFKAAGTQLDVIGKKATAIVKDTKGNEAALSRLLGRTDKPGGSIDDFAGNPTSGRPSPGGAGGNKKDDAASAAADRIKREKEFWEALKGEVETASLFGIEAQKFTKERELQKILTRDLTDAERARVGGLVQELANTKAVTTLKQASFELANKIAVESQRTVGLTESQKAVEDELFKYRLSSLNSGATITSEAYKVEEDKLRKLLEQNQAIADQAKLLQSALETARQYSPLLSMRNDLAELDKKRAEFLSAFNSGTLRDALGQPLSDTVRDSVLDGIDRARADLKSKPLEILSQASPLADRMNREAKATSEYRNQKAQLATLDLTPEARRRISEDIESTYERALANVKNDVYRDWSDMFNDLGDLFGGKIGNAIKGISSAIEKITANAEGKGTGIGASLSKLLDRSNVFQTESANFLKGSNKSLTKGLGEVFKEGNLATAFAKGLARVEAGAAIGGRIGDIGEALGLKGSGKGAKIGGAIGGLTGNPLIAAGASIIGGLIGAILHKPKHSNSGFATDADGNVVAGGVSGSNAQLRKAATGAAGSVIEGLQRIASDLGGKLTGAPNLSIGTWDGKWRVNDFATTKELHSKNFTMGGSLHDFGDNQAGAIEYAIKKALTQGVITGLPDVVSKALTKLSADSALQFAKDWSNVLADYSAMTDPVGAAIKGIIDPLKTLRATMIEVGASTEDLTKLQSYQDLKMKDALKSQMSSINDFLKALKGDGSGITKKNRLDSMLLEFEDYRTRIAAGDKSVDQSAFTSLGQEIFNLSRDVYGTATTQFQGYRSMLIEATTMFGSNITDAFNAAGMDSTATVAAIDTTNRAINSQTDAVTQNQNVQTDLLKQMVDQMNQLRRDIVQVMTGKGDEVAARNGTYNTSAY